MSLARMMFLSTLLAGWAAFFGWLVSEFLVLRTLTGAWLQAVAAAAVVGAAIGAAVGAVAGLGEGNGQAATRAAFGFLGGMLGGLLGGLGGQLLYSMGLTRAAGWALMGLGIGATDGLLQSSARKTRNGLIGGALGGLVGGLLFGPIGNALSTATGMASRATGFVIMGLAIGAMIGIVQIILREAWVTVVDGFRTGRQLILSRPVTVMGRAEHISLPFLGNFGKPLEMEHARIVRQADGRFLLEDNNTKTGTRVNNQPVNGSIVLSDGDIIRIGSNYIRFNEQVRRSGKEANAKPVPAKPALAAPPRLDDSDDLLPVPIATAPVRSTAPATPALPKPAPPARPPLPSPPRTEPTNSSSGTPPKRPSAPPSAPSLATQEKTAPKPLDPDACPHCRNGTKHPGKPGQRYCMVHDQMY